MLRVSGCLLAWGAQARSPSRAAAGDELARGQLRFILQSWRCGGGGVVVVVVMCEPS